MSAAIPLTRTPRRTTPSRPRRHLHVVPRPLRRRSPKPPFVLVVVVLLSLGLASLLALNTLSSERAFRVEQLQQHSDQLTREEQALRVSLLEQSSPFRLAQRAESFGLRQGVPPQFLQVGGAGAPVR